MLSILKIIGTNIKQYRKSLSMSQEKLAEEAGLHRTYIGAVERGERNISAKNIAKIAEVLGIEPYVLMKNSMYRCPGVKNGEESRKEGV